MRGSKPGARFELGFAGVGGGIVVGVMAIGLSGCAKPVVSDLDAYQGVPMNRALPFPSEEERARRVFEVVVIDRPSPDLDEQQLRRPRSQVRVGLEKIAASFGAAVIERSQPGFGGVRSDRPESAFEGVDVEIVPSGDYVVSARFTNHRHEAVFSKPIKLPLQTEEERAKKPGTCLHTVKVDFDVQLVRKGWDKVVERTFLLTHQAKQENKNLDQACTISPVHVETLFENAIDEALTCLELPLGTQISPRGHVLAHRKAKEGESHIFQVSLGADQGVDATEPVEFRRVEVSEGPDGEEVRSERVIAKGVATDQITADDTWIAVDLADVKGEILEGDVVRRVFSQGLINDLTGPNCKRILVER